MRTSRAELAAVLALAAALVALGAAFGSSDTNVEDTRLSSLNDGRRGLRALHLVLDELGVKPRRQRTAPAASDPTDRTLVLAAPSVPVTRRETERLVAWVEAGGRLAIVAGRTGIGAPPSYESTVLTAFGLMTLPSHRNLDDAMRVEEAALDEDLGAIDWPSQTEVVADKVPAAAGTLEALVAAGAHRLAARLPYGTNGGEVVVLADASLLDNQGLRHRDNAVLAMRLLLGRGEIAFDEFHHGFRADPGGSEITSALVALIPSTWPGRALLVALFGGALWLLGAMVRLGAPDHDRPPPRRALSEHADALGRIFQKARARNEALSILAAGARRTTGPRAGIPASLAPAEFVRRLRTAQAPGAAELAEAIARADAKRFVKEAEMAEVAATLASAKRRFLHGG